MTSQSESLPITMPTSGAVMGSSGTGPRGGPAPGSGVTVACPTALYLPRDRPTVEGE